LSAEERVAVAAAQRQSRGVRQWRRSQAIALRAAGLPVQQVAPALDWTETSVYNCTAAYRRAGVEGVGEGVGEGVYRGAIRCLDAAGEAALDALLGENDPQAHGYHATGWTIALAQTELAHRTGATKLAGKRPYDDETTLREFPPLRVAWARVGAQTVVVVSGRNSRQVLHGALNAASGELALLVRERSRADDCLAFVEALGQAHPGVPKLLVWDNAPPHHPKRVLAAAAAAQITITWLPFRAPELMPCEDLWRRTKAVVAANRVYDTVQDLAERAVAWLHALTPLDRLRQSGLLSSKFQWLST
jgi:transposase